MLDTNIEYTPIKNYVIKRLTIAGRIMVGIYGLLLLLYVMRGIVLFEFVLLIVLIAMVQSIWMFIFLFRHRAALIAERNANQQNEKV